MEVNTTIPTCIHSGLKGAVYSQWTDKFMGALDLCIHALCSRGCSSVCHSSYSLYHKAHGVNITQVDHRCYHERVDGRSFHPLRMHGVGDRTGCGIRIAHMDGGLNPHSTLYVYSSTLLFGTS